MEIEDRTDISILTDLQKYLDATINFESSKEIKTLVINNGVNETLDNYKDVYNDLESWGIDFVKRLKIMDLISIYHILI